ncbi:MAG: hypothetical protein ABI577_10570 [bacterium]
MKSKMLLLAALPFAVLALAGCGDGPVTETTPTVRPTPTSAVPADGFGPAPVLGDNIVKVSPEHASHVTRASTITTNPLAPKGVCVDVTFDGLPQYGQAFRFIVDEKDVTAGGDTSWRVASQTAPKDGTLCFSPKAGLAVGKHTAAIGVQDSTNVSAPFKQVVAWAFEVTQ